jgi:hypothetical protein
MNFLSIYLRPRRISLGESLKPLPWVKEQIVRFEWEQTSSNYILKTSASMTEAVSFEIDAKALAQVTSDKLSTDISNLQFDTYRCFKEALKNNQSLEEFSDWWKEIATREGGKLFQFDFSKGPWEVPWEMLLGLLKLGETRTETTIVRCIGQPENTCRGFWTEALKTLIIRANAPDLDLDKDVNNILQTWNGLEQELKDAVLEPKVIMADKLSIVQQLREYKPHMIWFLGHGSFDGMVHLEFSKDEILTASEFSGLFDAAGHCPEFAVFWACETSEGSRALRSGQPDLFAALSSKGVGTMIGMQSVIADDAAIVMSSQLFRGVAHGLPLEWAIARARTWLYSIKGEETPTMDWAVPVVWTAKRPVAHLKWKQSELDNLQLQLLGTVSIERGQQGAELDVEPPDDDARSRANSWLPFPITVVRGDPNSTEHRIWFLRTLKGIQAISKNAVLVVVPEENNYWKKSLQLWAKGFIESLEKVRLPEEFFTSIDILSNDAEIGWRRLCSLKNVFLSVIGPPPANEDWFWTPFFQYPDRRAILTESEIPERFKELRINYVNAGGTTEIARINAALQEHYRLLAVLSLLNIPIRAEKLREPGFGWKPDDLFKDWPDLFVKTFGGYVIRADARERVLSVIDGETLPEARLACLRLTDMMGHSQKPYLKELRIELLLDIGQEDQAVNELSDLLKIYRERQEQVPMLRAATNKTYFKLRNGLTVWEWFQLAGLFLQFGEQQQARYWLSREPEQILDIPYKLSLQAELTKNDGDIDRARDLIEQTIARCKNNQENMQISEDERKKASEDYLVYRHDRALLLQFQESKPAEAAEEYRQIIHAIEEHPIQNMTQRLLHLSATARRNLGECVLDLDSGEAEDRWREAEAYFLSALELERSINPVSYLNSETYYQLAKLYEKQSKPKQVRRELEQCITTAEESRHGLVAAIAKNRLLWLDIQEKNLPWDKIAQRWDLIADSLRGRSSHSWAARTLINSNVNAARLLMKENQYAIARECLLENLNIIRKNKMLRRGEDLTRIAKTLAGLQLIAEAQHEPQQYWTLINSEFTAVSTHIQEMGWNYPKEVWEGRSYYGYS